MLLLLPCANKLGNQAWRPNQPESLLTQPFKSRMQESGCRLLSFSVCCNVADKLPTDHKGPNGCEPFYCQAAVRAAKQTDTACHRKVAQVTLPYVCQLATLVSCWVLHFIQINVQYLLCNLAFRGSFSPSLPPVSGFAFPFSGGWFSGLSFGILTVIVCWYSLTVHCKGWQAGFGNSTFQSKLEVALLSPFQIDFFADLG